MEEFEGTSSLQAEETFHFRALGSGKVEILQSRGRASSRWIHACWTTCLVSRVWTLCLLGKMRKEQPGDANED